MKKPPKAFVKQMEKMYPKGATITPAKKLKRFEDGGEVDAATMEAGTKELERIRDESAAADEESAKPEYKSFKEAFAANRKAGVGTFEYNGKKYTTEMAGARKEVAAAKPAASTASADTAKPKYETPYDRMNRTNREASAAKSETASETARLASRVPAKGRGVIDTSNVNPNTLLPRRASGGVVARSTVKSHGKAC